MKLLHPVFCYGLLVLRAYQSGATNPEVCQEEQSLGDLQVLSSSGPQYELLDIEENKNFSCSLHPTNVLNCSWSFLTVQPGTRIHVYISVCDDTSTVRPRELVSDEPSGGTSVALEEREILQVVLHFNVSQGHTWAVYSYVYDAEMMEVLPPPGNISASVDDDGLVVSWELPYSRATAKPSCFEYQLDVGDKERPKLLSGQLSYTTPNVDPSATYAVRVRARKVSDCSGSPQWSRWSNTVKIEQSFHTVNVTVIVLIALGIPMILLALLMVFRHQRLAEVLYPPIPRPPLKYKHFLEDNNIINFYHPALSVKCEEEITVVEETEQKTF
ncbi:granulocyte-macrophage colony-stimulating factor receptor subunit alpha-like [Entelurus aequoreus]|uniref:granulocyte-macrophage colony-stimulating factor receptor subunit alpha-like n=1 Tax=Entelurus aequoreus TaxID=161455 RepID=UPI002B1E20C3|nr:granulocyte-macrophage colony-stimulating factor receptor subunit alpha-like [Entelurus aequoreus]XP_061926246.1 granulocyte-macrophage colony-stimulating factor receptor subunit alpha-like [Entelurus aequoreus]